MKFGKSAGFEVSALAASTSTEAPDAPTALAASRVDAICQIPGNLTAAAFASIRTAASRAKGRLSSWRAITSIRERSLARLAVRILRGESPARIPIQAVARTKLLLNLPAAHAAGLRLSPDLINNAEQVIRN